MPIGTGGAQPQGGAPAGPAPSFTPPISPSVPGNPPPDRTLQSDGAGVVDWYPTVPQALVYRPGGPGGDGSYSTWAALYTAFGLTTPGDVVVLIDDSYVSPAVVPTGTRDWGYRATFVGFKPGASVSFAEGAVDKNVRAFEFLVLNTSATTTLPLKWDNVSAAATAVIFRYCALLADAGTKQLCQVAAAQTLTVLLESTTVGSLAPVNQVFSVLATGTLGIRSMGITDIRANSLLGAGGSFITVLSDATASVATTQPAPFFTPTVRGAAANCLYTPSVAGDWPTGLPTLASGGMDTLAARLSDPLAQMPLVTDEDFLSFATTGTSLLGSTVTWQLNQSGTGATIAAAAAADMTNRTPGAIILPTGTTAGGRTGIMLGSSGSTGSIKFLNAGAMAVFVIEWTWLCNSLFSAIDTGWLVLGLTNNITLGSAGQYGLFWRYDGGASNSLSAIVRANNVETGSALGVATVVAGTIYRCRVESDGVNVTWKLATGRSGGAYTPYLTIPLATIAADVGWSTNLLGVAARVQKTLGITSIRPVIDRCKMVFTTY